MRKCLHDSLLKRWVRKVCNFSRMHAATSWFWLFDTNVFVQAALLYCPSMWPECSLERLELSLAGPLASSSLYRQAASWSCSPSLAPVCLCSTLPAGHVTILLLSQTAHKQLPLTPSHLPSLPPASSYLNLSNVCKYHLRGPDSFCFSIKQVPTMGTWSLITTWFMVMALCLVSPPVCH